MKIEKEEKEIKLYSDNIKENITNWIEQDIILPDSKPDAIKIINVTVNPYITQMEVSNGSVKVIGKLNYFIIYKASESEMGTRGVLTSVPFTQNLTIKNITPEMNVNVTPVVKNVIYALPNERKISVKSEVIFKVSANSITKVPLISNFKNDNTIQMKTKEEEFNNIIEYKCETITSREDIMLPEQNSDFGEILKISTRIINTEYKQSYNKLLVKGDVYLKILYLSETNTNEIKKAEVIVPFTGMLEFSNIRDVSMFNVKYTIKDFNVKPNLDITSNKTINVDYQVLVCATMYEKETVRYVEDFYSENKNLSYKDTNKRVIKTVENVEKDIEIRENFQNAIPKENTVIDYDLDTSYLIIKNDGEEVTVEGNLKINVISQNPKTMEIDSKNLDIPVQQKIVIPEITVGSRVSVDMNISNVSIENGNELVIKATIRLDIEIDNVLDMSYIEDIEEEDLDIASLDSISIYVVKPKDTLWSIAKKYKTTVEKIAAINNLENINVISEGQKLLIIR